MKHVPVIATVLGIVLIIVMGQTQGPLDAQNRIASDTQEETQAEQDAASANTPSVENTTDADPIGSQFIGPDFNRVRSQLKSQAQELLDDVKSSAQRSVGDRLVNVPGVGQMQVSELLTNIVHFADSDAPQAIAKGGAALEGAKARAEQFQSALSNVQDILGGTITDSNLQKALHDGSVERAIASLSNALQSTAQMLASPTPAGTLAVVGILPHRATQGETMDCYIRGSGFTNDAVVALVRQDQSDIIAARVEVHADNELVATFAIDTHAAVGDWSVRVRVGQTDATLDNAFAVVPLNTAPTITVPDVFKSQAQVLVDADGRIRAIIINDTQIRVDVMREADLFGFIPVRYVLGLEVNEAGNVMSRSPWWLLFTSNDAHAIIDEAQGALAKAAAEHPADWQLTYLLLIAKIIGAAR